MCGIFSFDEYRDRKNLLKKFEAAYGNAKFFDIAMKLLSGYHERAYIAFSMYFGYKQSPMRLKDIGKQLNCSQTRARYLSNMAFSFLIHPKYREKIWKEHNYKPSKKSGI